MDQAGRPDPGSILLVIHDFKARSSDELSLIKGDRVELVERDDDFGDGWYLGRHLTSGHTGLFPEVYTKLAPRGQNTFPSAFSIPQNLETASGALAGAVPAATRGPITSLEPATAGSSNMFANVADIAAATEAGAAESTDAGEDDRTPQASRHTSGSGLPSTVSTNSAAIAAVNTNDAQQSAAIPVSVAAISSMPRNVALASAAGAQDHGTDSPVMTETLGVIQEHISNMGTPRNSSAVERRATNDSGSEYSSHIDHRLSYINGEETDEEDSGFGEDEVSSWTADQVADYLASVGVERKHCEYFREQEITGDVLLAMDQDTILHPQFEIGPVGRRLKTWTKIKTLQNEVYGFSPSGTRRSTQNYGSEAGSDGLGRIRAQSHTGATVLPRITSFNERPGSRQNHPFSQQQKNKTPLAQAPQATSPVLPSPIPQSHLPSTTTQPRSSTMTDAPRRPSAASIRDLNHSWRQPSNDFNNNPLTSTSTLGTSTDSSNPAVHVSHKKGPSFDRSWQMGTYTPPPARPISTGKPSMLDEDDASPSLSVTTPWDFERGYFSGGEAEGGQRNVLKKKGTSAHSRNSSYTADSRTRTGTSNANPRHSRFGSMDSFREPHLSSASEKYYGLTGKRRTPSSSSIPQVPPKDSPSPIVTTLEDNKNTFSSPDTFRSPEIAHTPDWFQAGNGVTAPRVAGIRAISEAVTGSEKSRAALPSESSTVKDDSLKSPSITGSTTSGGPSLDMDSPNSSKPPSSMTATPGAKSARKKSKKETSAYTRGLMKKTPQEQMVDCDYSGWMKKKGSGVMATWKPRLFILRGRRLSYYYSETDTQERGLIDISAHRVLPANDDFLTGVHATLTGATRTPTSPLNAQTETMVSKEAAAEPASTLSKAGSDSMFIFKLVPPRQGASRGLTFTKQIVHYFACPNITEGRLWMAALMKATIDRDERIKVVTTYQQKTISLDKARAMRTRPPALMNLDEDVEDATPNTAPPDLAGLNIRGIIFNKDANGHDSAVSGMVKPGSALGQRNGDAIGSPVLPSA